MATQAQHEAGYQQAALQQAWRSGQGNGAFTTPAGGGGHFDPSQYPSPSQHQQPLYQHNPYAFYAPSGPYAVPASGWDQLQGNSTYAPPAMQHLQQWSQPARPTPDAGRKAAGPSAHRTRKPEQFAEDFRKRSLNSGTQGNLVSAFSSLPPFQPHQPLAGASTAAVPPLVDPSSLSLPAGSPQGRKGSLAALPAKTTEATSPVQDLNFRAMSKDVEAYKSNLVNKIQTEVTKPASKAKKSVSIAALAIPIAAPAAPTASSSSNFDRLRSPLSVSPLASGSNLFGESAAELEANDPLATQMWKFFSKAKGTLPHSHRMENLSWRMGGMKLGQAVAGRESTPAPETAAAPSEDSKSDGQADEDRGRGRRAKSTSNTPEYSGSSGPSDMDWKSQSRSRSHAPAVADMDWRGASRSRSRVRPRLSMPLLHDEAPPSSALHDSLPSIEQDLYSSIFGSFDPLPPASDTDWLTSVLEKDTTDFDWSKHMSPRDLAALRSYNMDPVHSVRQNGSVPGLLSEANAPENQNLDFGFIPKLVRKTSADAFISVGMAHAPKKAVALDDAALSRQLLSTPNVAATGSIDLAALSRPAPTGLSPLASPQLSPGLLSTLQGSSKDMPSSAYAEAFKGMVPGAPAASPWAAAPYAFNSLPSSPNPAVSNGYFTFPAFNSQSALTNSYVDPSVLNQLATLQTMGIAPQEPDLAWGVSPDALSDLASRPTTPGSIHPSRTNSFADLASLGLPDLSTNHSFEGGPKRTSSTKRKGDATHGRSQSIPSNLTMSLTSGAGGDSSLVCSNCKTSNTPLWRRDEAGKPLCNGCGLFKKLHGVDRPLSLATGIIKKRNRSRIKDKDDKKKPAAAAARRKSSGGSKPASNSTGTPP